MNANIKATNIELTDAISDHVNKRLLEIEKFVNQEDKEVVYVEVGKTTNHHKQGDVYKAEFNIKINDENYFTVSEKDDLYQAIDEAKEQIISKIVNNKKCKKTLFRRGASKIKDLLKGITRHNHSF